jgi:hypothetical protein
LDIPQFNNVPEPLSQQLFTVIKAKANIAFANRFSEAAKRYTADNRALLMEITLNFWEQHADVLEAIEQKLDVVTLLTQRVMELENKVNAKVIDNKGGKTMKMNDGTEVDKHE